MSENTIAFGILTDFQICIDNDFGWCREAFNTDEEGIINELYPSMAPLCFDHTKIMKCPYIDEYPVTNTTYTYM